MGSAVGPSLPLGAQVQLELQLPGGAETAEGQVYAYDAATDRLVLRQPGSTPFHSTLRVLKGQNVTRIVQLKPASGPPEPLPAVDLARCREREEKAVRAAEAAKIGVGVGRHAQVRAHATRPASVGHSNIRVAVSWQAVCKVQGVVACTGRLNAAWHCFITPRRCNRL